ncbi:MAG: integration host factor subunit beta [Methylococcales bacterium]|nr:integration host factor subunit beta [Methylococcales bacterium]
MPFAGITAALQLFDRDNQQRLGNLLIEIRDFGSFNLHHRTPRIARNPKTGAAVKLPAKVAVHFKPGNDMQEPVQNYGMIYRPYFIGNLTAGG